MHPRRPWAPPPFDRQSRRSTRSRPPQAAPTSCESVTQPHRAAYGWRAPADIGRPHHVTTRGRSHVAESRDTRRQVALAKAAGCFYKMTSTRTYVSLSPIRGEGIPMGRHVIRILGLGGALLCLIAVTACGSSSSSSSSSSAATASSSAAASSTSSSAAVSSSKPVVFFWPPSSFPAQTCWTRIHRERTRRRPRSMPRAASAAGRWSLKPVTRCMSSQSRSSARTRLWGIMQSRCLAVSRRGGLAGCRFWPRLEFQVSTA